METAKSGFGLVRILMILAALVTAVVHLVLGLGFLSDILGYLFLLNAVGFIGLTAMYLRPLEFFKPHHELLRWVLVGFSAVTIVLWVVMNGKPDLPGVTAKAAEVALIVLLLVDRGKR